MTGMIIFALWALAAAIVGMMLMQGLSGKADFLSLRNFFLVGFIVFQLTSAAVTLSNGYYYEFPIFDLPKTAVKFFAMACLFVWLFLLAYNKGWIAAKVARWAPVGRATPGAVSMLTLAIVFIGVGIVFQHVLAYIPVLGKLTGMMGVGIVCVAAGMAAWVYVPRLFNPVIGAIGAFIVLLALGSVMQKAFGRRDILSVLLCCIWGAYHGYWKWLRPTAGLVRLGALAGAGVILLAAFTAVRSGAERDRSAMEYFQLMKGGDIKSGVLDVFSGQLAGLNSLWLIENYPARFEYQTLHSLVFFIVQPVPRDIWENKPNSLGRIAVDQAGAGRQKADNFSIGPGLLGHIAADNPFLALITYAIGLGLLIRFFDELIRLHPYNPFVVLPIGTALGQIVGLARGELGLFLFQAIAGMLAAWGMMFCIASAMSLMGWRMTYEDAVTDGENDSDGESDERQDYGADSESSPSGDEPRPTPPPAD